MIIDWTPVLAPALFCPGLGYLQAIFQAKRHTRTQLHAQMSESPTL